MHRILTGLDLAGNQVFNMRVENVEVLPENPETGRLVYHETVHQVCFFNGTDWVTLGGLFPATRTDIGGIIVGENLNITPEGVLTTDSVAQYFSSGEFPVTGNEGKLYISLSDETIFIWDVTNERYLVVNGSIDFVAPEATVTTLSPGQPATVTVDMSGTRSNKKLIFNFGIPKGDTPNIVFTLEENGDLYVEY